MCLCVSVCDQLTAYHCVSDSDLRTEIRKKYPDTQEGWKGARELAIAKLDAATDVLIEISQRLFRVDLIARSKTRDVAALRLRMPIPIPTGETSTSVAAAASQSPPAVSASPVTMDWPDPIAISQNPGVEVRVCVATGVDLVWLVWF